GWLATRFGGASRRSGASRATGRPMRTCATTRPGGSVVMGGEHRRREIVGVIAAMALVLLAYREVAFAGKTFDTSAMTDGVNSFDRANPPHYNAFRVVAARGAGVAACLVGGMLEVALFVFVITGTYAVYRLIQGRRRWTAALRLVGATVLGFLLAAPLLARFAGYLPRSLNQHNAS